MKKNLYLIAFGLFFLVACHKEELSEVPHSSGVYVINEGNFNFGNGEISFYDPATNQATNRLFQSANGYALGDVAQSMFIRDSLGFIVVNNSAKVEVVAIPSFRKTLTLQIPGAAPRYILPINDSIAYVTELYVHQIHVVNYRTGAMLPSIAVPQYTEHLIQIGNDVFVEGKRIYSQASSRGALLKISTLQNALSDSIRLNGDAGGLAKDKSGNIWVAVNADSASVGAPLLLCYNNQLQEVSRYVLPSTFYPTNLCTDADGENLYFLSHGVYRYQIATQTLSLIIPEGQHTFFALAIDPSQGDIYVSDVLDYVQPSLIYRYSNSGSLIYSFTAGIISGNFTFSNE